MISGYLAQTTQYFSESKDAFLQVNEMHPTHAANAAARYIREACRWAAEAGAHDVAFLRAQVWMIRQPLFKALVERANKI
jgi:hypothetical protein